MIPKDFVNKYLPYAKEAETSTGISAIVILAQSAIETGWGEKCPGNMMFGIKDTDGLNGNEQLVTTTEYHATANVKYPVIISIKWDKNYKKFKYRVKDWFRKYDTPADSFKDHCKFFFENKRYAKALAVKDNPELFIKEVAAAGYATGPAYSKLWLDVAKMIKKISLNNEKTPNSSIGNSTYQL